MPPQNEMAEENDANMDVVNGWSKPGSENDLKKKDDSGEKVTFEEALKLSGMGKYNYVLLALSIYTLQAAAAEIFSIGVIVTISQCDLELDIYRKGLINSIPMLGVIAGSHFWGYLADTRGRKYTMMISSGACMIFAIISSFANDWIFMAVAKFCSALCAFGANAVIYTLLGESTPEIYRGRYLLYLTTGIMCAQSVIYSISYSIQQLNFSYYIPLLGYNYRPWRLVAVAYGSLNGINLLILWLYSLESPKFYFANGNDTQGLEILKNIYSINTGKDPATYPVKSIIFEEDTNRAKTGNIFKSMWEQTAPLFRRKYIKNTLVISYISTTVYCVGPPFVVWLPEIINRYNEVRSTASFCTIFQEKLIESNNNNTTVIPVCNDKIASITFIVLVSFGSYLPIVSILSVIGIRFIGKKWIFICIHVLSALCALIIDNVPTLFGIILVIGMMSNVVCMGITTSYAVELFPTYMRAMAVCLTIMFARFVSSIFLNVIGTQLLYNCNNFLYILSVFILSGAAVCLLLPADKKQNEIAANVEHGSPVSIRDPNKCSFKCESESTTNAIVSTDNQSLRCRPTIVR